MQEFNPEHILSFLKASKQEPVNLAFLFAYGKIYYSFHAQNSTLPLTAITKLIQGISEKYKENSHFILRNKIYTSAPPTNICLSMIKVAAKRFVNLVPAEPFIFIDPPYVFEEIEHTITFESNNSILQLLNETKLSSDTDCMQLALALKEKVNITESLALSDRKISAILVDAHFNLLAYGLNSNSKSRARHAEIDLIYHFYKKYQKKLPIQSKIFVTLKPCIMCANIIANFTEDINKIKVFYYENDQGKLARKTVLDNLRVGDDTCSRHGDKYISEHFSLLN